MMYMMSHGSRVYVASMHVCMHTSMHDFGMHVYSVWMPDVHHMCICIYSAHLFAHIHALQNKMPTSERGPKVSYTKNELNA